MRLTIKDIIKETGYCADTIRKYADSGKIPHGRTEGGWRVFSEKSIEAARELAGMSKLTSSGDDASSRKK